MLPDSPPTLAAIVLVLLAIGNGVQVEVVGAEGRRDMPCTAEFVADAVLRQLADFRIKPRFLADYAESGICGVKVEFDGNWRWSALFIDNGSLDKGGSGWHFHGPWAWRIANSPNETTNPVVVACIRSMEPFYLDALADRSNKTYLISELVRCALDHVAGVMVKWCAVTTWRLHEQVSGTVVLELVYNNALHHAERERRKGVLCIAYDVSDNVNRGNGRTKDEVPGADTGSPGKWQRMEGDVYFICDYLRERPVDAGVRKRRAHIPWICLKVPCPRRAGHGHVEDDALCSCGDTAAGCSALWLQPRLPDVHLEFGAIGDWSSDLSGVKHSTLFDEENLFGARNPDVDSEQAHGTYCCYKLAHDDPPYYGWRGAALVQALDYKTPFYSSLFTAASACPC